MKGICICRVLLQNKCGPIWVKLTWLHYCTNLHPSLPVEHRPSTTPRHGTLFWAVLAIPNQLVPWLNKLLCLKPFRVGGRVCHEQFCWCLQVVTLAEGWLETTGELSGSPSCFFLCFCLLFSFCFLVFFQRGQRGSMGGRGIQRERWGRKREKGLDRPGQC